MLRSNFLILLTLAGFGQIATARKICSTFCDGDEASLALETRIATTLTISGRLVSIHIEDRTNVMFATLENGMTGDNLYLERSFDGGVGWEEVGLRQVMRENTAVSTALFNFDDPTTLSGLGAVRACARARDTGVNLCTAFVRSTVHAETPHDAAVAALMQFYQDTGKWKTVGWWNAANCLTAMIQYMTKTGSEFFKPLIAEAFEKNMDDWWGNFTSDSLDDTAWWALAWLDAYDLTGEQKYLDAAVIDAELIGSYRDSVCGDGVWWNIYATYKNAITNELYIQIVAKLANRLPAPAKDVYLTQAKELWTWFFLPGGMVNDESLINDGLHECRNNNDNTWTYNQGVILGAAVELFKATGDSSYLDGARKVADAVIASSALSPNGILTEICESTGGCDVRDGNNPSFKGVFMRNLGELNRQYPVDKPYQAYLEKQVESNMQNNRNIMNQYGFHFAGPFDFADANRQHSVVDAFNSILP